MVEWIKELKKIQSARVLVAGDLIVDSYTIGSVQRVSPEAPVPVLHVKEEKVQAGGAGNVALSLLALGMNVSFLSRVGNDALGEKMKEFFASRNVNISGLVTQKDYQTPLKNRMIASHQQILRVDFENVQVLPKTLEYAIIDHIHSVLEGIDVLAISDYAKGFLSPQILQALIEEAKLKEIPIIVDPKGSNFGIYNGADIIKPNLLEAYQASKLANDASLEKVSEALFKKYDFSTLFLTRSEEGISIFHRQSEQRFDSPAHVREVKDVTGAGDTVLASLCFALANGFELPIAAKLCNIAAGMAVEHTGCFHVSLSDLFKRMIDQRVMSKFFIGEQIPLLQKILKKQACRLLRINNCKSLHPKDFNRIRQYASKKDAQLLLSIDSVDESFIEILSSLEDVRFIIQKSDEEKLIEQIDVNEVLKEPVLKS